MADLDLQFGGDLTIGPDGDLVLVDGSELVRQRIERRLLTPLQGDIWEPTYGAGLPQRIGNTALAANIRSLVIANIALESSVAKLPLPTVTVAEDEVVTGLYNIQIGYTDAASGNAVNISLEFPST